MVSGYNTNTDEEESESSLFLLQIFD